MTFLEEALKITSDPAERARLHAGIAVAARHAIDPDRELQHAEAAVAERRRAGDREEIALAISQLSWTYRFVLSDPAGALDILTPAWAEFADLEATPAGVELMTGLASSYNGLTKMDESLAWADRCLPVAENLGLLAATASAMVTRASTLYTLGRAWEGHAILRGAHQLALANDLHELELRARVLTTFFEQWSDPTLGLALAREGLDIGRRLASRSYGYLMIGNGTVCALRVGDWEWPAAELDEWLAIDTAWAQRSEFFLDRSVLRSLRGEDGTTDIAEATRILLERQITDPQWDSYTKWASAWAAFTGGHYDDARTAAEQAVAVTSYFAPLAYPLAVRAALHLGEAQGAAASLAAMEASGYRGSALAADQLVGQAGLDALEGRGPIALAGYREALRAYRQLGLAFDEAMAVVDMAVLLPSPELEAPDVVTAIEGARETLRRLGARPFLERLDGVRSASPAG